MSEPLTFSGFLFVLPFCLAASPVKPQLPIPCSGSRTRLRNLLPDFHNNQTSETENDATTRPNVKTKDRIFITKIEDGNKRLL